VHGDELAHVYPSKRNVVAGGIKLITYGETYGNF